jgi:hypothetical protein
MWRQRLSTQPALLNAAIADVNLRQQMSARTYAADFSSYRDQVLDEFLKPVPVAFTDVWSR